MLRLTDSEWKVMEVLWPSEGLPLGAIVDALIPETGWSRTTVHTYLTRMTAKGLVHTGAESPRRYRAAVSREACADSQRRELVERVAREDPDLIVITGDLIDQKSQLDMVPALARGLSAVAPTYYVTGNHEWALGSKTVKELKALLGESGVTVLSNRWEAVERNGDRLALAGVDDPNGYADQTTPEELYAWIQEDSPGLFTLLLAHRNDRFPQYAAAGYGFVLSGHGHGGIVRLPFLGGLIGTNRRLFPQWTSGLYAQGDSVLFVSRGLGNNTVPFQGFRIFNRPELAVVTLKS